MLIAKAIKIYTWPDGKIKAQTNFFKIPVGPAKAGNEDGKNLNTWQT